MDRDQYRLPVTRRGSRPPTGNTRVIVELSYLAVCWMLVAVGGGTVWFYLFVVLTLPSSMPVFFISAISYGGAFAFEGGEFVNLALWIMTPIGQVALARRILH